MDKCSAAAQQYGNCTPHHGLPFTGLDLIVVLIAGLVLMAIGYTVRRVSNSGTGR